MDTYGKWRPHISPKMKKIVSVTFEDGATIQVDDAELELGGYLRTIENRREDAFARKVTGMSADQLRTFSRARNSLQASENASKLRKPKITKAVLVAYKNQFYIDHPYAKRGWQKAACLKFAIDQKTLNERMKD